jgi:hypothetical protein
MFGLFKGNKNQSEPPQTPPPPQDKKTGDDGSDDRKKFIACIPGHAESHIKMCKEHFGVDLDYSAESLKTIDEIITKNWPKPPNMLNPVVISFGSYVGETIRRLLGGEWAFDPERGYTLANVGGASTRIFPFAKVEKRFVNGEGDSIGFYFAAIGKIIADEKSGKQPQ